MLGMRVCEKCHEKDRAMTKCSLMLRDHHFVSSNSECQICGKKVITVCHCTKYRKKYTLGGVNVRMSGMS
jgi:hypothetical protein